jgi:hypothetical protein
MNCRDWARAWRVQIYGGLLVPRKDIYLKINFSPLSLPG